jgi:hypothetical protein
MPTLLAICWKSLSTPAGERTFTLMISGDILI